MKKTDEEWQSQLTAEQYQVTRCAGTERAFTGLIGIVKTPVFIIAFAAMRRFDAATKYDSGTGWPSFFQPVREDAVSEVMDNAHGMVRVEVVCQNCEAHLGHVFPDEPPPTGQRYCMNGTALNLKTPAAAASDKSRINRINIC